MVTSCVISKVGRHRSCQTIFRCPETRKDGALDPFDGGLASALLAPRIPPTKETIGEKDHGPEKGAQAGDAYPENNKPNQQEDERQSDSDNASNGLALDSPLEKQARVVKAAAGSD